MDNKRTTRTAQTSQIINYRAGKYYAIGERDELRPSNQTHVEKQILERGDAHLVNVGEEDQKHLVSTAREMCKAAATTPCNMEVMFLDIVKRNGL